MNNMVEHVSVLLNESISGLDIKKDGVYVDLTLGRAGHSSEILKRLEKGRLIGFDKDDEAILKSTERLEKISSNFIIFRDDFRNFRKHLEDIGITKIDGILMDLGVSSPQFDEQERGFSYQKDAPLDMRMDQRQLLTAREVVNEYPFEKLLRVFNEYGEDKFSYKIAQNIVKQRVVKPIETTFELVEIIKNSKPQKELAKKGHPAKQIFQAIRIEVNDELGALKDALKDALEMLNINGRIAVITFHSLEDRIVKNAFNDVAKIEGNRLNLFELPSEANSPKYHLVNNKVIVPTDKELEDNPRSKSSKLRIIQRDRF